MGTEAGTVASARCAPGFGFGEWGLVEEVVTETPIVAGRSVVPLTTPVPAFDLF
jgi:hypothetical protein